MRIALITIGGDAEQVAAQHQHLLGRSIALRQLDFALDAGCDAAIGLGDGNDPAAGELRRLSEKRGMKFRAMGNTHNLLGAVGTGDELLVIAPGLVPESGEAADILKARQAVLVLPVEAGVAAGFERIDAARAWAGALLMPGRLVERLAQLPRECDAPAALLRIALQAGVETRAIAERLLADGSWIMATPDRVPEIEMQLLERRLPQKGHLRPSQWLAARLLRRFAPGVLRRNGAALAIHASVVVLGVGACLGALYGFAGAGLFAVAACALLAEVSNGFHRLRISPLLSGGMADRLAGWGRWLVDAALLICAALAITAEWPRQLFPPLVLLLALHTVAPSANGRVRAVIHDRAIIAVLLGIAALAGYAEYAVMALALIALAILAIRWTPREKKITAD